MKIGVIGVAVKEDKLVAAKAYLWDRFLIIPLTVMAFCCVLALAGCGRKAASTETTAGTKTPITFTFYSIMGTEDRPFTDPVARKITEATGVTLEFQHPVGGQPLEAIPLMIASGEYPDLLYVTTDIPSVIEAGALIPLDDLIESRGKNIKAHYGDQLGRLRNSQEDPHIYQLGYEEIVKAKWSPDDATILVQHAALKDQGYPKMETLDDVERVIKAYKAKYPTINGQPTIGISMVVPFYWLLQVGNTANFMMGFPDNGEWIVNPQTYETVYKYLYPGMDILIRWFNRMHAEGLLDPECFTQSFDEFQAKIASGRVLAVPYPAWINTQSRMSLITDNMAERTYAPLPIVAQPGIKHPALKDPGFSGGWGLSITKSCKDPERLFEFLDWMCSEEAQILLNWGIEGVNYTVENGKRIVSDEEYQRSQSDIDYGKITGVGYWTVPFPMRGAGYIDSTGNYMTPRSPDTIKRNYLDVEKETLAGYGVDMWTDLFPPTASLGGSDWGQAWQITLTPDIQLKYMEAHSISEAAIGNLIYQPPSQFNALWEKYQQDLKDIGMLEASAQMTELVKGRVNLWNQ